jgi:hypothetical protein
VPILRFVLRVLFWPIGLILLGGTACLELMSTHRSWTYWREYNHGVLVAMGLADNTSADQ